MNIGGLHGPLLTGFAQKAWDFRLGSGIAASDTAVDLTRHASDQERLPELVLSPGSGG